MQVYYSIEEISKDIGISRQTLTKRVKKLGLDSKKLGNKERELIIADVQDEIDKKNVSKDVLKSVIGAYNVQSVSISSINGATYEQRLEISKQKLDFVTKELDKLEKAIADSGSIIDNANGSISQSPVVKTFNDYLKSYNTLQKTINELEEKLKLSTTTRDSAIDD